MNTLLSIIKLIELDLRATREEEAITIVFFFFFDFIVD